MKFKVNFNDNTEGEVDLKTLSKHEAGGKYLMDKKMKSLLPIKYR